MKTRKLDRIDQASLATNPRATLKAWGKFESLVIAAYRQHPKPYIYRPSNMAPVTVVSRLRDAIRGKIAFDYPSEIATLDIANWYEQVILKSDKEQVFIGPPEELNSKVKGSVSKAPDMIFDSLTFEEMAAFTLLLSGNRILGPVLVKTPPDISLLPTRPNVTVMGRPDGSLVLV